MAADDHDKIDAVILQVPTDKQIRQIEELYRSEGWWHTDDSEGFRLIGDFAPGFEVVKKPLENFGIHIEYNYFGKGHCVSFSTTNDTYYVYPIDQKQSVTKLHFATEELYAITRVIRHKRSFFISCKFKLFVF